MIEHLDLATNSVNVSPKKAFVRITSINFHVSFTVATHTISDFAGTGTQLNPGIGLKYNKDILFDERITSDQDWIEYVGAKNWAFQSDEVGTKNRNYAATLDFSDMGGLPYGKNHSLEFLIGEDLSALVIHAIITGWNYQVE